MSFTILDSDGDDLKLTDPDQSTPPFVSFLEGLKTFLCHIIDSSVDWQINIWITNLRRAEIHAKDCHGVINVVLAERNYFVTFYLRRYAVTSKAWNFYGTFLI